MKDKRCSTCKTVKPLDQFNKNRAQPGGYEYECRDCRNAYARNYMRERRQSPDFHQRELDARRGKQSTPERLEQMREYRKQPETIAREKQRYIKDRAKKIARAMVRSAIRDGRLPHVSTLHCADCQQPANEYHHESYEREHWLAVIPLYAPCHEKRHYKS